MRLRFAPSPTGYMHIGGARTALYNWLHARQQGGTYILRMEDTDAARNTDAARETIFRGLEWLGLSPDEGPEEGGALGPYSQSERNELYLKYAAEMISAGAVYPCFCSKERLSQVRADQEARKVDYRYDGTCRGLDESETARRIEAGGEHTWRLKVPETGRAVIQDLVRGEVGVDHSEIEDIILIRANGVPIYNFAVVIDDHLMEITDVVRGEDHLTNTFKQLLIYDALGWDRPQFAHLPLILAPTGGGKLSKRKHPEAALELYQQRGYPAPAVINWLALVGWSFDDKTEIMTREELVERFSFARVNKSGARLPLDKLDWLSGEYIRAMSTEDLGRAITPFLVAADCIAGEDDPRLSVIVECVQPRISCFSQAVGHVDWAFSEIAEYEKKAGKNLRKDGAIELLQEYAPTLTAGDFASPSSLEADARAWCETKGVGFGKLVHPVRAALTGRSKGPGLFHCAALLGAREIGARVAQAVAFAEGPTP